MFRCCLELGSIHLRFPKAFSVWFFWGSPPPFLLKLGRFVWSLVFCLFGLFCVFFDQLDSEIRIFLWAICISGISGKNLAMSKLSARAENKRATNKRREPTHWVTWRENYVSACNRKKVLSNKCKFLTLLPRECWMTGCSKADAHLLLKEAQFHIVANNHSNFA